MQHGDSALLKRQNNANHDKRMASLPALLSWQDTPSEVARRLPLAFQFMNFQVLFFSLILVDAMIDTYLGLVWEYTVHGFGYLGKRNQ